MSNRVKNRLGGIPSSSRAVLCGAIFPLMASYSFGALDTVYTYTTPGTAPSTPDSWANGTNWSPAPVSGNTTELTFTGPITGVADTTVNDIPGTFLLNDMDLNGAVATGAAAGSIAISGNPLDFVSNGTTGPVVNLSATAGTAGNAVYTVANNIIFGNDTSFTNAAGTGTGAFDFSGTFSGSGAINKSGSATMYIGTTTGSTANAGYAYSGNLNISAGAVNLGATGSIVANFYTTGNAAVSGGTLNLANSSLSVATLNLTGTGTLTNSGALINRTVAVNSTGATSDLSLQTNIPADITFEDAGAGNLLLGTLPAKYTVLQNSGVGTVSAVTLTNVQGAGINTFGTITGASGAVKITGDNAQTGYQSTTTMTGGTIFYQPVVATTGAAAIVDTANAGLPSSGTTGYNYRVQGGTQLKLDANTNTSLEVVSGAATATAGSIFARNGTIAATMVIMPSAGSAALGSTDKLVSLYASGSQAAVVPTTNGIYNPWVVVANNDTNQSADFVSYSGGTAGAATDTGFQAVSTVQPTNYFAAFPATSANTNIVELNASNAVGANNSAPANTTLSGATSAYALRADNETITFGGNTLTLGASGFAGLILNAGTTLGPTGDTGTLAFGGNEADVYVSGANATINTNITSTSGSRALTKFGPGTLFLTGTGFSSFATGSYINLASGALDVGTLGGATSSAAGNSGALPNSLIYLEGGVLQANGTFNRSLGTATGSTTTGNAGNVSFTAGGSVTGESGGFSAHGSGASAAADALAVNLGGNATPTTLTWGSTGNFLNDFGTLEFGSTTANGVVTFQNPIALGNASAYYYRQVNVTAGVGGDSAVLAGAITDTAAGVHGLLKEGNGTLMVSSASNAYTGLTGITAGTFGILAGGALGNTGISVNSGATFAPAAGTSAGTVGAGTASLTAASGSAINLADGTVGTFMLNGTSTGTPLVLNGTTLSFDLSSAGADDLIDTGAASLSGTQTITVIPSGTLSSATYDLLQANGGLDGGSGFQFAGGGTTETVTSGGNSYLLTLSNSPTVEYLTVAGATGVPEPTVLSLFTLAAGGSLLRRRRQPRGLLPNRSN